VLLPLLADQAQSTRKKRGDRLKLTNVLRFGCARQRSGIEPDKAYILTFAAPPLRIAVLVANPEIILDGTYELSKHTTGRGAESVL
jgi:hypothetical protein